jgi:hypothetical protein
VTPRDRAREARGELERIYHRRNPITVVFDEIEDLFFKKLDEQERAIRREYETAAGTDLPGNL